MKSKLFIAAAFVVAVSGWALVLLTPTNADSTALSPKDPTQDVCYQHPDLTACGKNEDSGPGVLQPKDPSVTDYVTPGTDNTTDSGTGTKPLATVTTPPTECR